MIKPITFCIPSSKNEKEYTLLLLESLMTNTEIDIHEILIFIDSDNQNTYDTLLKKKKQFPNMRIYNNNTGNPFGSQTNVSIMFNAASNDIVCYLQSDMVVGKDLDKHICDNINSENDILCFTRIEPPLHPASPEKIVENLGIIPEEFDFNRFNYIVDEIQKQNKPILKETHFAPFALLKKTWFEKIDGFDTQFRCSREDSDFIVRCKLNGLNMIQSWNTIVYHFTCVSSRGKDWFKTDNESIYKNELQKMADMQELFRFIRKWGKFSHNITEKYNVGIKIDLDRYVDINKIISIEPFFSNIYLNDLHVVRNIVQNLEFNCHYYSNLRWKYTPEHWENVKYKFNPTDFSERVLYSIDSDITNDIIVDLKYSELESNIQSYMQLFQNIQEVISQNNIGDFMFNDARISIRKKINLIENIKKLNTNWDNLLNNPPCLFK